MTGGSPTIEDTRPAVELVGGHALMAQPYRKNATTTFRPQLGHMWEPTYLKTAELCISPAEWENLCH
jgi:hypothetical protein